MSDEIAFLNALTLNPTDDVCRLAYSDWLEEREDIGKATYLRLIVRAVEQIANGEELGATRDGLWPLIATLDDEWRIAVGRRFDVRLEGYDGVRKIAIIKLLRDLFSWGLYDAKAQSEALPNDLTRGCALEQALTIQTYFLCETGVKPRLIVTESKKPSRLSHLDPTEFRLLINLEHTSEDSEPDPAFEAEFRQFLLSIDPNCEVRSDDGMYAFLPSNCPAWLRIDELLLIKQKVREFSIRDDYWIRQRVGPVPQSEADDQPTT